MSVIRNGAVETRVSLSEFTILVHEVEEGETGYWGEVAEMPGCVSQGETLDELRTNIHEAIEAVLHYSTTADTPSYFKAWPPTYTGTA